MKSSTFKSLPNELGKDILGQVAASSFVDLCNAKLTCKEFFEICKEDDIYGKISLEKLSIVQWQENSQISKFLEKCRSSGNPEALFRKGVVDYFRGEDVNNAFEYLQEASRLGHSEASYVVAIILLFSGGELKEKGIKLLSEMKRTRIWRSVKDCRQRLQSIIRMIWVKNVMIIKRGRICCTIHQGRRNGWESDDEVCRDNKIVCDECICDEEIAHI